ncbi:MAG: imidazole glycerol phosphate synthase subunit HisF [Sulfolobales archaeon]
MVYIRVIPCLDMDRGVVVKGKSFRELQRVGDPVELARRYEAEGADEIAVLDISASPEDREFSIDVLRRIAKEISIPILAGGGVRSLEDAEKLFRAGADKVSVNTHAVRNPKLITEISRIYGSQSTVIAIDAKRSRDGYRVFISGGRVETPLDPATWASRAVELGAGEVLLTSIDADGNRSGYDLELISLVSRTVNIPIIASGGAGSPEDMARAVGAGASAVLAASIFHYEIYKVYEVKEILSRLGVRVRIP